jgi:diguanylate cyclase (GGDEF)-like protein
VPITTSKLRFGVVAGTAALASVNALAPFGDVAARWGAIILQAGVGIGVLASAAVMAHRSLGVARSWRVLVIVATASWLIGDVAWWSSGAGARDGAAPTVGVAAYFLPPVTSLAAMVLLTRAGGGLHGWQNVPLRHSRVVAVLDGLVAAAAFSMVALMCGLGAVTGAALPRSQNPTIVTVYTLLEMIVVVLAVLMAMAYHRDGPQRTNFLFLSGGVVLIVVSDRLMAYVQTIGVESGHLWVALGAILGPSLILFAVLDSPPRRATALTEDAVDWVQSLLPYSCFVGVVALCAFHVLIGQSLPASVVFIGVVMIVLVTVRQAVATRAQQLLTRQLFETQHRLAHQVHHDPLTGLPNRLLFAQRLHGAMRAGDFVLIFVDLDDFKEVNDQYGHAAGDELLCAVGVRLRGCIGAFDTLARIGGDEFAMLIEGQDEAPEIVADKLRVALRDPFVVHGSSVRVRASMGLVRPGAGEYAPTSDDLMRQADISMYAGKRLGKDTAVLYHPSSDATADFPSALRQANGGAPPGFRMVYQPIVALPHGRPVAVEALARWTASNGMQIPPETFVAVAEGAGLGAALDAMVLDVVCREVQEAGLDLDVHVNVGAARLGNESFERQVVRTLTRHAIDPERLVLEITETVPIVDVSAAAATVASLSARGVKVALDDFGAGYNSLTHLHALPVRVVKLDRSLAVGTEPDRGLAVYRSVIGLCDALGLDVIAEGIECAEQADTVFAAGCRLAQGYLFGRAVPMSELGAAVEGVCVGPQVRTPNGTR